MNIVIVTTESERDEMKRTLDAYCEIAEGKISRNEFLEKYPRKIWIDTEECSSETGDVLQFLVVDNREGECFAEGFDTLDGALLYATDVHMTPEHQEDWDYMGAVKDGGDIVKRLEERDEDEENRD